jgi:hypothetical protein
MRYGVNAKLFEWSDEIMAGCPSTHSGNLYDQCGARCRTYQRYFSGRF